MGRHDRNWLSDLRSSDHRQDDAIAALRSVLVRDLKRILWSHQAVDENAAEDFAQDALVQILKKLETFEGRSRFLTWARSIAVRIAISELRRHRWKDISLDQLLAGTGEDRPVEFATKGIVKPESIWDQQTIVETMHELIRTRLTDRQRLVLLAELKGMPQDEIARHLKSNRNAVYKLSHDARKRLKRALEEAGYEAAGIHAAFGE